MEHEKHVALKDGRLDRHSGRYLSIGGSGLREQSESRCGLLRFAVICGLVDCSKIREIQ